MSIRRGSRSVTVALAVLASLFTASLLTLEADGTESRSVDPKVLVRQHVNDGYGRLPLHFEKNDGQTDRRVKFMSKGPGYTVFLTAEGGAVVSFKSRDIMPALVDGIGRDHSLPGRDAQTLQRTNGVALHLKLVGASTEVDAQGRDALSGTVNYLRGDDPTKWHTGIQTYTRVAYSNVYPGIDVVYYGNQQQLEYDFIVQPGADPRVITLEAEGAERLEVDGKGDLLMRVGSDQLRQRKPVVYQDVKGVRHYVTGRYLLKSSRRVQFELGPYDRALPLVIDPVLAYSTYVGSPNDDQPYGVVVDAAGDAYITGTTNGNFPTTLGAFSTSYNGGQFDIVITKVNATGTALVYSTFLGGSSYDSPGGVAIDQIGQVIVIGQTMSSNFPTTAGAFDTTHNGQFDVVVTKLNTTGTALVYSTFLGGSGQDTASGIAVDQSGNAYVTGVTQSSNFPTTVGAFDTTWSTFDSFVTKLGPNGATLAYSTLFGSKLAGTFDTTTGIAVDAAGSAYITGVTYGNIPTTPGAFDETGNQLFGSGIYDAFVTKFDPTGSFLLYSTILGGTNHDWADAIAVDEDGHAYVLGQYTSSNDFPVTAGAFDTTFTGGIEVFVTKLSPGGDALVYSTFLGGSSGEEQGFGLTVDSAGVAYVTGFTNAPDFPTTAGALDTIANGADVFLTKLNAGGGALLYSTLLGGSGGDFGYGVAVDTFGDVYIGGKSFSADFPTTPGAHDINYHGSGDAFMTKITMASNAAPIIVNVTGPAAPLAVGTPASSTVTFTDADTSDTHTCTFAWDDGTSTPPALPAATVNESSGSGSCSATHVYTAAGVYSVEVTVSDGDEVATGSFEFVVVYDPNAGFVTGGGRIASPAGAYKPNPGLTGNAIFGFVSKYKTGASTPTGNTEFQFQAADFRFQSATYEWLVVAGHKAQYKGTGTINGAGNYSFMLTATDGQSPGGGGVDKLRIKIWDGTGVIYDNVGGSDDLDTVDPQAISNGSIVIHAD